MSDADALREQVAWACRILAREGYVDLTLGHVSARLDEHVVLIKRKGVALDEVTPDDVVEIDLDGAARDADVVTHLETVLHTEVYRARPDVGAVVHGHPPYATALAATEEPLQYLTHDAVLFPEGLARFEDSADLIVVQEQGRAVAAALGAARVVLLRNHGVLVVGKDVPWAVLAAVTLERAVAMQAIARTLGTPRPLPDDWVGALHGDKYRDGLVEEYWQAWVRREQRDRGGFDAHRA